MEDAGETIEHLLRIEADAAVQEVEFAVKCVEISKALPNTKEQVYMNLTTKEGQSFCVEFSVQGFRVRTAKAKLGESPRHRHTSHMRHSQTLSLGNRVCVES